VNARGKTVFPIENLWKKYGVLHNKMDSFDKIMIYSIILNSYHLEVFQKGFIYKLICNFCNYFIELDPDDYDRFDDNSINFYSMESIGYFRTILGFFEKY